MADPGHVLFGMAAVFGCASLAMTGLSVAFQSRFMLVIGLIYLAMGLALLLGGLS